MMNAKLKLGLMITLFVSAFAVPRASAQTFPSDSQWIPLQRSGVNLGDVRGDASGGQGERDLVGDTTNAVGFIYQDASYLFFRVRVDGTPLKNGGFEPFGWGCAIDTDGDFSGYEFLSVVDGILNPDQVQYRWNKTKSGNGVLSDPGETVVGSWAATTHARTSLAGTTFGGDADYVIDWAIPLSTMRSPPAASGAPAFPVSGLLRIACGTSNNAERIDADPAGLNGSGGVFSDIVSDPIKCGATSCTACNVAAACGSSCAECTGGTPACRSSTGTCVRCVANSDCPSGATCANNACSLSAPSLTAPGNGSQINATSPTITGSSAPNAVVTVFVDNAVVGTVTANASGAWSLQTPMALAYGTHTTGASATVGSGNLAVTSTQSATTTFTIIDGCLSDGDCGGSTPLCDVGTRQCVRCFSDSHCPSGATCVSKTCVLAAPAITTPTAGSTINDSSPTISGTAPSGATVTISIDGAVVGSVAATAGGSFSFDVPTTLATGAHNIEATASVGSGVATVTSAPSPTSAFTLISGCLSNGDCSASTPRCRVADHVCVRCLATADCPAGATCSANACALPAPAITSLADGATINVARPTVTGTAQNGAVITLWVDGVAAGSIVASGGSWSITPTQALVAGPHQMTATAKVGEGALEVSSESASIGITLVQGCLNNSDCAAPSALCKTASNVCVQCLGNGDCGEAAPVCVSTTNQCVRCVAAADCPAGASCEGSACVVPVPTINSPAEGLRTRDRRPEIAGTSLPGALVTFYVDDVAVATAVADGAGGFVATPTIDLSFGSHALRATATVGTGAAAVTSNSTAGRSITVINGCLLDSHCAGAAGVCDTASNVCVRCLGNVDCAAGATCQAKACTLSAPIPQTPGSGSTINSATPVFEGTAVPGSVVTVRVDGLIVGTAVAGSSGAWSVPASGALSTGGHTYTVSAQVGSGEAAVTSGATAPIAFTISAGCASASGCTAPLLCKPGDGVCVRCLSAGDCPLGATCGSNSCALAAPTITSPVPLTVTNVPRPTFAGTAVPGAAVTVTINGGIVLTTTANVDGSWQVTPTSDLPVGSYTVVASASAGMGAAAVHSPATAPVSFEEVAGCISNAGCAAAAPVCNTATGTCVRCLSTADCPSGATCLAEACVLPVPTITMPAAGTPLTGTIAVAGTAAPGSTVTVIIDGQAVGTTVADGQGMFTFTLPMALMPGTHTISVSATVGGGGAAAVSSGASVPATVQVVDASADAGIGMNDGGTMTTNDGGMMTTNDGGMMTTNDGGMMTTNDGGMMTTNDGGVGSGDAAVASPDADVVRPPVVPPGIVCAVDSDCGGPQSGVVCSEQTGTCVEGCRAMGGNACPANVVCTSSGADRGTCDYENRYAIAGGGCHVGGAVGGSARTGAGAWWALAAVVVAAARRRRKPR